MPTVRVFGIRHHGPGSARAVASALEAQQPDIVLIEGPPELDEIVPLVASADMQPPVAGFVYLRDHPRYAIFDPFASFSPEWLALQHAVQRGIPVRFIDVPAAQTLEHRKQEAEALVSAQRMTAPEEVEPEEVEHQGLNGEAGDIELSLATKARLDPLGLLAELAGYDDSEAWWEDVIEHQLEDEADPYAPFAMVSSAMAELRAAVDEAMASAASVGRGAVSEDRDYERNAQREACMRTGIRSAMKEGFTSIAVVCGAWHAPSLEPSSFPSAAADAVLTKGLSRAKVSATWVPWTHRRLGYASGYGAGIRSPGWYDHVFRSAQFGPQRLVASWIVGIARALREERLDASPASVIETIRLAACLAAIRGRPLAGLSELDDAVLSVLANGNDATLELVRDRIHVGNRLGSVPADTPMVPLMKDLTELQTRLRMKPTALSETLSLDVRKPNDLTRSYLLHRLGILEVPWGVRVDRTGRATGTFHEMWQLEWKPEFVVGLVEASMFGTTIESAATTKVREAAGDADLPTLSAIIETVLLASLPDALSSVLSALQAQVAQQTDMTQLMSAIAPLARVARYGDVRKTDAEAVNEVIDGLLVRICAGLHWACSSLDDDAAELMRSHMESVHSAVALLGDERRRSEWTAALQRTISLDTVHGLVAGRAVRLLRDGASLSTDDVARLLSLALSRGADAEHGAAWIDGFIAGDALLLLHDTRLLKLIDDWVATVDPAVFDDLVPLLRRTFSSLSRTERRNIGDAVITGGLAAPEVSPYEVDVQRAVLVLPRFFEIIGLDPHETNNSAGNDGVEHE